ncbi:CPBP family intramembrane metalloprotease [Algoriphagus lutimaris]|uniref:CPBP family intramembrane glutamic endopeptidase n=1 Tax=Algoriphagus lutimaris TaxID=613197 RepID=UPI00196AB889|nr:type II CAAX endopeptidase family protein [Algoriphagus lutimaris]MBN3519705.1 CPBP family intramembrane metalloprotease [Algoriphagus lutimaris]
MKNPFSNSKEGRLRAGWRIFIFLLLFWGFASIIFLIKPLFGEIGKREFLQNYSLIIVAILAFGATASVFISRKYLDKKSLVSLGIIINKRTIQDIFFGFLLSGLMVSIFFVLLYTFNLVEFNGLNFGDGQNISNDSFTFVNFMSIISIGSLSLLLLEHILVGYWEELVFRGYILQNMIEGMGFKLAIIISCLLYGIIHAANPNAGILSSLIIVLFGYLRIYGYLSTKMLWLSMGMHMGWNFFQGPIFGFAASGHKKATLMDLTITSNIDWLTGGEFGPEGSVIVIPIILIALFIMNWYSKKQNRSSTNYFLNKQNSF